MSFEKLEKSVLLKVAEEFGVDVKTYDNKKVISAALIENGVTWDMYTEVFDVEQESETTETSPDAPAPVENKEQKITVRPEPTVLLKMERANPRFEIRGYVFTKKHPFLPVKESDANFIISNEEGFRIAMPSEAEEFYS